MTLNLTVSPTDAMNRLNGISGHKRYQAGLPKYFKINHDGTVDFESICWLYMWATAGYNCSRTAAQVRQVWEQIFEVSVNLWNLPVFKPKAKASRYHSKKKRP
jgi:hypothetical protein